MRSAVKIPITVARITGIYPRALQGWIRLPVDSRNALPDDAFRYRVFVKEEVLADGFLEQFRDCGIEHLKPLIHAEETLAVLNEFRRLRTTDLNIYLRNGSINRINGLVGMTFSCDGAHYIDHKTSFEKLDTFSTSNAEDTAPGIATIV